MTANADLAATARAQADDAMGRRKALLCASVALAETSSITAARKVLREWNGPEHIRAAALDVLGQLAREAECEPV